MFVVLVRVCAFVRKRRECGCRCAFDLSTQYLCVLRVNGGRDGGEKRQRRMDESSLIRLLFIVSLAPFLFLGGEDSGDCADLQEFRGSSFAGAEGFCFLP